MSIIEMMHPKYNTILPISKVKITYRPFTVKEEKILLLAQEETNINSTIDSVNQIISNCTFGKLNVETVNKIDAEWLFIQIRNKSMGEGVPVKAKCKKCQEMTSIILNFDKASVINPDKKNITIKLMDNLWVTLRYPTIKESMLLSDVTDGVQSVAMSLDTIIEGENVKNALDYSMEERIEFVESLTNLQLLEFKSFFDEFPAVTLDIKYTCKCGNKNEIHLEGIDDFFSLV